MTTPRFMPMLATPPKGVTATELLEDDRWAMDIKADGIRCAVMIAEGKVSIYGRDGQHLTKRPPAAVTTQLHWLGMESTYVLDGELVDGTLYLFDMPVAGELVGPYHPWYARRAALDTLLEQWPKGSGVVRGVPYATTYEDKLALIDQVVTGRGEGLVAKRIESTYREGVRSRDWVKVKRHHEVDCVVMWLGTAKANMGVGVYRDGELVEVAEVGRLTGDGARCVLGSVISVRCAYSTATNKLIQPTLPRLRCDKAAVECGIDQLDATRTNPLLLAEITGEAR